MFLLPIFPRNTSNFEMLTEGSMEQTLPFQMIPNLSRLLIGINLRNCWKGDFLAENRDHFLMRALAIHNTRSATQNLWGEI